MDPTTVPPHVLIFRLPVQGHLNSMLKLAELLWSAGIHVTFLTSTQNHARLLRYTDVQSRFGPYPGFRFQTLPETLYNGEVHTNALLMNLIDSLKELSVPFLRDFLASGQKSCEGHNKPVTFMIADRILTYVLDLAQIFVIPDIDFRTVSACASWAYFCITKLIEAGELPLKGDDMDVPIANVSGMEAFLRGRDLPSFCCADLPDASFQMVLNENRQTPRARGLILNAFGDLEGPILSQIRTHIPKIYTIGPLHAHLKARLPTKSTFSNSLWEEDKSCMKWLDEQPLKSVIYVSFGSITSMTRDQLLEFWHGLVNSGNRFLWVLRPDSQVSKEATRDIPAELVEGTKARGLHRRLGCTRRGTVSPSHSSIGVFLTHSGWNSTLESIVEGVPMICWQFFVDQHIKSRFVGEVWKLGLDMKDTCNRVVVEKMIRGLMEVRKDEFADSANKIANLAKKALSESGTSYCNLYKLIEYTMLMVVT